MTCAKGEAFAEAAGWREPAVWGPGVAHCGQVEVRGLKVSRVTAQLARPGSLGSSPKDDEELLNKLLREDL